MKKRRAVHEFTKPLPERSNMTQLTRMMFDGAEEPERDYRNRKPFRTWQQKLRARETAKRLADGAFRAYAHVSFHN